VVADPVKSLNQQALGWVSDILAAWQKSGAAISDGFEDTSCPPAGWWENQKDVTKTINEGTDVGSGV